MKARRDYHWKATKVAWEDGEREALIAGALARGQVTQVPSVKPEELERLKAARRDRSAGANAPETPPEGVTEAGADVAPEAVETPDEA